MCIRDRIGGVGADKDRVHRRVREADIVGRDDDITAANSIDPAGHVKEFRAERGGAFFGDAPCALGPGDHPTRARWECFARRRDDAGDAKGLAILAVSYTHLDVYKRQHGARLGRLIQKIAREMNMERPKSIVAFERAFWGSVAVGLLGGILGWNDLLETYQREPSIAAMGFGSVFLIAAWCISLAFQLLFWYMIARKGSNVTRWIYVCLLYTSRCV